MSPSRAHKPAPTAGTAKPSAQGAEAPTAAPLGALLPAALCERLAELEPGAPAPDTAERARAALVRLGLCDGARPAVTLELFGGLRLRTGCRALPLHAGSVGEALDVLRAVYPRAARLLPADTADDGHHRYSLNGREVTADVAHALAPGDHLVVFSASVGG